MQHSETCRSGKGLRAARQADRRVRWRDFSRWPVFLLLALVLAGCSKQEGKVINRADNKPVPGAAVIHNGRITYADAEGKFTLEDVDRKKPVVVKVSGYRQVSLMPKRYVSLTAGLDQLEARGVFLSQAGVGAPHLREPVLKLKDRTELNALVVDIKGQRGLCSFSWEVPLGHQIGAFGKITIDDPDAFVRQMHAKNIYLIGRISVFKDEALAGNKPEWAIMDTERKKPYREADLIPWTDPFQEAVWDYNLALARGAAEVGFDEIQFDNLRFPVPSSKQQFSQENTKEAREATITRFLEKARKELATTAAFLSVTISSTAVWKPGEAEIGQNLETITPLVDYICPNIFPSDLPSRAIGLQTNPIVVPKQAVAAMLGIAIKRSGDHPEKIRPWLQGFKDYSRLKKEYKEEEIAAQIVACREAHIGSWMIYNQENLYPDVAAALKLAEPSESAAATGGAQP